MDPCVLGSSSSRAAAQRAERWGFAGLLVADSQNLAAEPELLDESNERFAAEVLLAL